MMDKLLQGTLIVLVLATFSSCRARVDSAIQSFLPISNYDLSATDTLELAMDLEDAVHQGIAIPSASDNASFFEANFELYNKKNQKERFHYIIYYQNESYKDSEYVALDSGRFAYNPLASKNFYGCWDGSNTTFKATPLLEEDDLLTLTERIQIVGNPRNEQKYFGSQSAQESPTKERITAVMNNIESTPEWYESIVQKATLNGFTPRKQLFLDALWVIESELKGGPKETNNRWKRNPRVGNYSFLLVVVDEAAYQKLPYYVKDIGQMDTASSTYMNPFYYFLQGKEILGDGIWVKKSDQVVKVKMSYDLSKGVYIDMLSYQDEDTDESNFNEFCGSNTELYQKAQFQQHFQSHIKEYRLKNIPLKRDVLSDYTLAEFQKNKEFYSKDSTLLLDDYVKTTNCPCLTVGYDPKAEGIFVINPGNDTQPYKKENVGVKARIGFTYGKYTATIKFPKLLNQNNVWNGLTSAFWLIYHSDEEWNYRDICNTGYLSKATKEKTRVNRTFYSEIDIEIVKTSKFWTQSSYGMIEDYPQEDATKNNNLMVTCTNWDLACKDQKDFFVGVHDIEYQGKPYTLHRWNDVYQAVTLKTENPHSETVGDKFYYQIDWQPDRIIWRIGTDRNDLKVVGYMDNTVTNIPNNQMVPIISQEFHYGDWWPAGPYHQDFIPYPEKDLRGEIYAIEIE